jgi:hypothetical protein
MAHLLAPFLHLHDNHGLIKKSADWKPEVFMWDHMARKLETLGDNVVSFLGKDIIQEESAVAVHMPEMMWKTMQ